MLGALIIAASLGGGGDAFAAFPGENGKLAYSIFDPTFEVETTDVCTRGLGDAEESCFRIASTDDPAWSPSGTRLAVSDLGMIYTVNPDGTDPIPLSDPEASDYIPHWSPDGDRIAFTSFRNGNFDIYVMDADGTDQLQLTSDSADDLGATWSPDGQWIAFWSDRDGNYEVYKMRPDGTAITRLTNNTAADRQPDWSPDGAWIAFDSTRDGNREIYKIRADGTDAVRLTNSAAEDRSPGWSPDGTRIAFITNADRTIAAIAPDGTGMTTLLTRNTFDYRYGGPPSWQPIPRGYVRPKGATPLRVPLVPASEPCTAPNRTHGSPLSFPSCAPPVPESSSAFIGIGDGNLAPAKSIGQVILRTLTGGPGDGADVAIDVGITNVMKTSDRSDYTGELRLELPMRITDRFNKPSPSGTGPGTGDTSFFATVPCSPTADTTLGSSCSLSTTADSVLPGTVRAGARSIWAIEQVRLHDGGTDGDAETGGDNELFAVQGLFAP
jgi:TolB protein